MNRVSTYLCFASGCLVMFATTATHAAAANVDQRAVKFGTTLPAACWPGDVFFNTAAPAGSNLYACTTANTWSAQGFAVGGDISGQPGALTVTQIQGHAVAPIVPQTNQTLVWNGSANRWEPQTISTGGSGGGTGSGASMASQLGDLAVTLTNGLTLTIGANCSATTPCNVRFGALTYSITGSATAALATGTGTALIYISNSGGLTVGHNLTLNCSSSCTALSGVTSFPTDAIPIASWHATNGAWDPYGSDLRAFVGSKDVIAGAGMLATEASGHTTLGADPSVIALKTVAPSSATSACNAGAWSMDTNYYYLCVSQNTWRRAAIGAW